MLTAYLQCLSIFQMGDEMYLLHSPAHKESMQSTQTYDIKWHSIEFSAPNAKDCDPATTDCRGSRGMTCIVKRVQNVVCHSSCHTSLLPC